MLTRKWILESDNGYEVLLCKSNELPGYGKDSRLQRKSHYSLILLAVQSDDGYDVCTDLSVSSVLSSHIPSNVAEPRGLRPFMEN